MQMNKISGGGHDKPDNTIAFALHRATHDFFCTLNSDLFTKRVETNGDWNLFDIDIYKCIK